MYGKVPNLWTCVYTYLASHNGVIQAYLRATYLS